MAKIQRALISVSDKTGLVDFARGLLTFGVEIVSTGGTARALKEADIPVVEISEFTGFPEMLDGRVKTLHPKVHGGLLFVRGNAEHEAQAAKHGIQPIDLVVVNLYPFEKTVAKPGVALPEAIENIDIGGPSLLRSAAKNHASVTVVVDPGDYDAVLSDIHEHGGNTCEMFRWKLAVKAFETTSRYDNAIVQYFHAERLKAKGEAPTSQAAALPEELHVALKKAQDLRYGENPHQQAALYGDFFKHFHQLHGKELSYNNILDLTAAAELVAEFEEPTVAIIKHMNPCGVGSAKRLLEAWNLAYATDKQAPFGGIIAVNRPLDSGVAQAVAGIFSEVIIAPVFESGALAVLQKKKKNLRLIRQLSLPSSPLAFRTIPGGLLAQERDTRLVSASDMKTVTKRSPTHEERHAMLFAWRVVKHVKSNAIVFVRSDRDGSRTLGVGAGQMSRVDSSKFAVWKAREAGLSLQGSVVAGDAFFPFPDGLIACVEAGATAAIQPGGSVRDSEVIAAADERNVAMVFTGIRHFRH
ncbi:MAG TPA: bifunctional phosphoribosylaminoimidazolecarboxamide formyltransferase/IMP cyclohydrolase [Verrucomicrobiae bacterium]|nr:bifunctional phosphoribosylaminoimidazolecarboxamide formyltransferase/IMP cyclohydrolase [Verrucomicrobiae bacterium]